MTAGHRCLARDGLGRVEALVIGVEVPARVVARDLARDPGRPVVEVVGVRSLRNRSLVDDSSGDVVGVVTLVGALARARTAVGLRVFGHLAVRVARPGRA